MGVVKLQEKRICPNCGSKDIFTSLEEVYRCNECRTFFNKEIE
ncbi:MAG: transposase [Nanoarchaeota archaeon]|nr:transposase [Nanoarchaeota archaeon]MBU3941811.1 transposase [Nanoarchaeota archaeon]MBU4284383.1 transposase [Nanoarchaeota archaeon]MBU4492908.1 transposase [Nanoarchaeota archaeon]